MAKGRQPRSAEMEVQEVRNWIKSFKHIPCKNRGSLLHLVKEFVDGVFMLGAETRRRIEDRALMTMMMAKFYSTRNRSTGEMKGYFATEKMAAAWIAADSVDWEVVPVGRALARPSYPSRKQKNLGAGGNRRKGRA